MLKVTLHVGDTLHSLRSVGMTPAGEANAFGIHVINLVRTYLSQDEKCRLNTSIFLVLSSKFDCCRGDSYVSIRFPRVIPTEAARYIFGYKITIKRRSGVYLRQLKLLYVWRAYCNAAVDLCASRAMLSFGRSVLGAGGGNGGGGNLGMSALGQSALILRYTTTRGKHQNKQK